MLSAQQIEVRIASCLSGEDICKLSVSSSCTVEVLKHRVQCLTGIPQTRQRLMHGNGQIPLDDHACIADISPSAASMSFQMIQIRKPALNQEYAGPHHERFLRKAISDGDVEACLELLTLQRLPGLNERDSASWTLLHQAAWSGLKEVCYAILERPDFSEANAHDTSGLTALHCASSRGHLGVVLVLLSSPSFKEVHSADGQVDRNGVGWSARDIAERYGHLKIVQAIDEAAAGG